jgi:hypothetical protein
MKAGDALYQAFDGSRPAIVKNLSCMKPGFRVRQMKQQTGEGTRDFPISCSLPGLVPMRVASAGRPARLVYRRTSIDQTRLVPLREQCVSYLLQEGICAVAEFILGADLLAVVDLLRRL